MAEDWKYQPPCWTCGRTMEVLFNIATCTNDWCGKTTPCCPNQEPYTMKVQHTFYMGSYEREGLFCRNCGREITPPSK